MILMKDRGTPLAAMLGAGLLSVSLTACGTDGALEPGGPDSQIESVLDVAAAFYPLEFALEQIGGERLSITSLTQPGAEPHDVELTPRQVAQLANADLVVYLQHFQPAVDDAVASVATGSSLDVSPAADLTLTAADHGHEHGDEEDREAESSGAVDPHFWLDPTRYASVADAIRDRLIELDPEGADQYSAAAAAFTQALTELDEEFSSALQQCRHRDLVTGHAAFGYLADRYDLHQVAIAGLTPDDEPTAAQLRNLVAHVRESGVSTVYAETLANPAVTETVAREAGVEVRTLDPLEGLTESSAGDDYFEVMRANLEVLRVGQECS